MIHKYQMAATAIGLALIAIMCLRCGVDSWMRHKLYSRALATFGLGVCALTGALCIAADLFVNL